MNYDDFELHRPEDNLKNKSDVELEHFRALVGANKKTGLYEAHGYSLNEDVDAYAKNLGLTDGTHFDYNDMAKKVGMKNFNPNSASDKEELRDRLKDIQEHKLNEQKQNKSGSNASNIKNNYSKANSGREAVKNSSNKKNNKLSNKNGIDNDSNKLKKARKPILNKYKNNDNEEEKDDDKKKKKTTSKTLDNNALNVAKKTIGSTITRVANTLKAFASGDINEAMKNIGLLFFKLFGPLLISVIFLAIIIYMIFSPLMEVLKKIDEAATNVANFSEKLDNLYHGFGFQNTKDAFFDEIQDLNKKYYNQLDLELLMSTIFYSEIYEGYESTSFNDSELEGVVDESFSGKDSKSMFSIFKSLVKGKVIEKLKESKETTDENGLTYTLGKIYRLRKLARNQFANGFFGGAAREGELRTENLGYFLNTLGEDLKDAFAALIVVLYNYTIGLTRNINNVITSAVLDYLIGKGYNYTEEELNNMGNMISNLGLSLEDLVGDFFVSIGSIEKVDFDIDVFEDVALPIANKIKNDLKCVVLWDCADAESAIKLVKDVLENVLTGVNITFHTYQFSEEAYTNYLKKYYIPNMPEFRKYVYDKNGKVVDKEVNRIVREIYETKDMYINIFGKTYVEQTENYDDACVGAVNRDVVALLTLPVNIDSSTCVNFTKDYGFGVTSSGEDHKGIDFNEVTTKTKVNDPVYSIADGGKVLESSTDNTWSGTCKGGCLKIEYTPSANVEDNYKFTIIYEGMDHNSVTLTKDSTVNKGTQIGIVGSAAESEDGKMSSLHFAYLDNSTNSYIDPTNIIIPCSDHYEGDSNSAKVVNAITSSGLPEQFKNKIQLAALLGNLQQESSMTFDKMQKSTDNHENPPRCTSSSGSDGHALGIVQWDGRRNGLLDYAADKGSKWYNPDIQLNYLIGELTEGGIAEYHTTFQFGTKSHLYYNSFINATTVEAATKAYSKGFERCGNCRDEKRIDYANQYYQMLQSGNLSDIGGTTTSSSSSTTSSVGLKSCSTSSSSGTGVALGEDGSYITTRNYQYANEYNPDGLKVIYYAQSGSAPWRSTPFNSATIGANGCSVTSLAMVISYMLGSEITPVDVINKNKEITGSTDTYTVPNQGATPKLFEEIPKFFNLTMHRVKTIDEVIQTLKSGYPVVMNVGGTGYWSYLSGHYIVLTGVSSDGTKIYVNDPGRQGNRGLVLSTQEIQNSLKPSTATYYMYYTRN